MCLGVEVTAQSKIQVIVIVIINIVNLRTGVKKKKADR